MPAVLANAPDRAVVHDETIRRATLELVCDQTVRGVLINLIVLALACAGLVAEIQPRLLLTWYGIAVVLSVPRLWIVFAFRRLKHDAPTLRWHRALTASLVVTTAVWGIGAVVWMPQLSPVRQMFLYVFIIGMSAGASLFYNALRTGAVLGVVSMLVPPTLWLLLQGDLLGRLTAISGLFILVATIRVVLVQGDLVRRYFGVVQELENARDHAERTARTDHLTGLANRRSFHEVAQYQIEQARRHQRPMTLLLFDLDHFKSINDRYGHAAGDRALRCMARVLEGASRQVDVVGRIGGDEFAVLLPDTSVNDIGPLVQRLEKELADAAAKAQSELGHIKCSIGAGERHPDEDMGQWMARVDQALYRSKADGRGRVTIADS